MKQLEMTPALSAMIKAAVGEDVDTAKLAVFETIMLNTKPLPGKRGALFENAVVQPITLKEMVDHINKEGGHLPLISDHDLSGAPKGRLFHAALDFEDAALTMRGLFYLDETENVLISKLNAGSLDEVSVAFLSREFNCSECGWDYFGLGVSREHIWDRTCANGHKIGAGGVHGEMVGLNQFIETSLVARGAADKPKIVGKSQSKLAPEGLKLLAANGFETDELVVQASIGKKEDTTMTDLTGALTQIATLSTNVGTLTAEKTALDTRATAAEAQVTTLTADKTALETQVAELTTKVADLETRPEATVKTDLDAALAYLGAQYDALTVASGKAKVEGDARPKDVAAFTAAIDEMTGKLTSLIPVGGKAKGTGGDDDQAAKLSYEPSRAFGVRKN